MTPKAQGVAIVVPAEKIDEMIDLYFRHPRAREDEIKTWKLDNFAPQ